MNRISPPHAPVAVPAVAPDGPDRFINRELSWLAFNHRVVEEAENARHPLLERLRFVSISASNLDEFYSVRVAGLIGQAKAGITALSPDGRTPAQQLAVIQPEAGALMRRQQQVWMDLRGQLEAVGIALCDAAGLPDADRAWLEGWFMERVFPALTPLAIDPAHPFPFIPNNGLVLALKLRRDRDGHGMDALVPLPGLVERFVRLPASDRPGIRFVLLEDMVGLFLDRLFPGFRVLGRGMFRLIRDTGVEFEEEAEDLVRSYETALKRRRRLRRDRRRSWPGRGPRRRRWRKRRSPWVNGSRWWGRRRRGAGRGGEARDDQRGGHHPQGRGGGGAPHLRDGAPRAGGRAHRG